MSNDGRRGGISRRTFVKAAGAGGVTAGALGLAGCLGSANGGEIVMHADPRFQSARDQLQQALWDAGLDQDIEFVVQAASNNTERRRQDIQSTLQAGRPSPHIFQMDSGWTVPFILREQTVKLSDRLSDDVLNRVQDTYLDMSLQTASHPQTGNLHALPLFPDFAVMLYRKDLVEAAGYDTSGWETNPLTWQEFSQVVADAQEQSGVEYGFTTQAAAYEGLSCCTFNETMSSWGGAYFGGLNNLFEAGDRPVTVGEEPVLDTLRMMRSFMYGQDDEHALEGFEQICPTAIVQWTENDSLGPFENGNAIANRNWPFAIAETATEDVFGEDLGVMPIPYAVTPEEAQYEGTGGTCTALGGWNLAINPFSDRIDECVQVLEAFSQESVQVTQFQELTLFPPNLGLLDNEEIQQIEPIGRYTDTLQTLGGNAIPRPVTDIWAEQGAVIAIEVHNAYTQQKTPEQAMTDLKNRLQESEQDVGGSDGN